MPVSRDYARLEHVDLDEVEALIEEARRKGGPNDASYDYYAAARYLAAAQGVDGAVVRDPVEPGLQRGASVELVHRLPGPQEGLHRHVFGIVRANQPRRHGIDRRPQRLEGCGKGLGVAVPGTG